MFARFWGIDYSSTSPFKTYLMNNHIPVYRRFHSFAKGKMVIRLIASPSQALSPEISFHTRQYSSVLSALDILAFVWVGSHWPLGFSTISPEWSKEMRNADVGGRLGKRECWVYIYSPLRTQMKIGTKLETCTKAPSVFPYGQMRLVGLSTARWRSYSRLGAVTIVLLDAMPGIQLLITLPKTYTCML
jgi:hypothetical protein